MTKDKFEQWYKDPENWIMGVLYFNKEDKRLFPPKRFKALGWTINFANPVSVIVFIVLLVVIFYLVSS